jgi:hypothetical protein
MFDETTSPVDDWDLWLRVSARYRLHPLPRVLASYRVHSASMSNDVASIHASRVKLLSKYFGPPVGPPSGWPPDKRKAFGFGYRTSALEFIRASQPWVGWPMLTIAVTIWPDLLARLDTFYELACADQARGHRGQADPAGLERNGATMLGWLNDL